MTLNAKNEIDINMKHFVAGKEEDDKEQKHKDETIQNTEIDQDISETEVNETCSDTDVETKITNEVLTTGR